MDKIWTLFKREYRAAVKTKGFIISLLLVPLMMGGGFVAVIITENKQDTDDKNFVVIDYSGIMEESLQEALDIRNGTEIFDPETEEKVGSAYHVEFMEPAPDRLQQQSELSDRVISGELHAFMEIGSDILHPAENSENYLKYYSEHSFGDDIRWWFRNVIDGRLRMLRVAELNLDESQISDLFSSLPLEGLGLVTVDKKTGEQQEAEAANELQSFAVPYVVTLLMFMLAMMGAMPLLTTVMEEKAEKIAEVLLGSITPFQFMMGKVLGGIGVSLTTAAIYVGAAVFTLNYLDYESLIPYDILPWFFVFTALFILMVGSGMAALGATCNDSKDAQSLTFPAIIPIILPMFLIVPVIQDPSGPLATTMSFIPPFTPAMMMIRMATPVTLPMWQPVVGLGGVILFTIFTVWLGARIFRTAILIQGQKPTVGNLIKYAFKS